MENQKLAQEIEKTNFEIQKASTESGYYTQYADFETQKRQLEIDKLQLEMQRMQMEATYDDGKLKAERDLLQIKQSAIQQMINELSNGRIDPNTLTEAIGKIFCCECEPQNDHTAPQPKA